MKCSTCGADMIPLLTSWACAAECDIKNRPISLGYAIGTKLLTADAITALENGYAIECLGAETTDDVYQQGDDAGRTYQIRGQTLWYKPYPEEKWMSRQLGNLVSRLRGWPAHYRWTIIEGDAPGA